MNRSSKGNEESGHMDGECAEHLGHDALLSAGKVQLPSALRLARIEDAQPAQATVQARHFKRRQCRQLIKKTQIYFGI